jgi:hypothetical protein
MRKRPLTPSNGLSAPGVALATDAKRRALRVPVVIETFPNSTTLVSRRRGFRSVSRRIASLCAVHICPELDAIAGRYRTRRRPVIVAAVRVAKQVPRHGDVAGF